MNDLLKGKIPIEMNKVKLDSTKARKYISRAIFYLSFVILGLGFTLLWVYFGSVSTDYAFIDGQSYVIVSPLEDSLQEIFVKENQFVTQGQIVAKMSLAYNNEAAIAYNILQNSNLSSDSFSNKIEVIKKLEADIVARVAKLRLDENNKEKIYRQKVHTHVQAQLSLRNLNAKLKLGEKTNQNHVAASKKVDNAKKEVDSAKLNFEEASMLRAAIEAELFTMRNQTNMSNNRQAHMANAYLDKIVKVKELSVLRSPIDGVVVKIFAEAGQRLMNDQPVLQIIPSSSQRLAAVAYFSENEIEGIKVGQSCSVSLNEGKKNVLQGTVETINMDGHSATPNESTDEIKRYPIIISLIAEKSDVPMEVYPGMKATAIIYTNTLFGFNGFNF